MQTWWPVIGEISLMTGSGLGFVWAVITTSRRRRHFIDAATRPIGQVRWFLLNFLSMSAYIALVTALGLSAVHDILPQQLFWFLLGLSALAFALALMVPGTTIVPRRAVGTIDMREPPIDPPVPARRTA